MRRRVLFVGLALASGLLLTGISGMRSSLVAIACADGSTYNQTLRGSPLNYYYANYSRRCQYLNPGGPDIAVDGNAAALNPFEGWELLGLAIDAIFWSIIAAAGIILYRNKFAIKRFVTSSSRRHTVVVAAVGCAFIVLSLVQFPRGPWFDCSGDNGGPYQTQFGFPFVFATRSVSPSACTVPDNSDFDMSKYDHGEIKITGLISDAAIWTVVALAALAIADKDRKKS